MAVNNFDSIAPIYDRLANLVFGNSLLESQTYFSSLLKNESDLLILGGGSGKLLEQIPVVKSIDFVEKSAKMISLAGKRKTVNQVSLINQDFFQWESEKQYDFIFCPFFLDCFNKKNLEFAIARSKSLLKGDGRLLVSDFENDSMNMTLSKLMHIFFRISTNLESKKLKPIHEEVISQNFELVEEKFFYQKMIFYRVYRNL